jgi:hypothetical protein
MPDLPHNKGILCSDRFVRSTFIGSCFPALTIFSEITSSLLKLTSEGKARVNMGKMCQLIFLPSYLNKALLKAALFAELLRATGFHFVVLELPYFEMTATHRWNNQTMKWRRQQLTSIWGLLRDFHDRICPVNS